MNEQNSAESVEWAREALAEYDLVPQKLTAQENQVVVETEGGTYRLHSLSKNHGEGFARFWNRLSQGGFSGMPRLIANKYGDLWIRSQGQLYALTEEISGEAGAYQQQEFQQALGQFLANFHQASAGVSFHEVFGSEKGSDWLTLMDKRLGALEAFGRNLERREFRSSFDEEVLDWTEPFIEMATRAVDTIKDLPITGGEGRIVLGGVKGFRLAENKTNPLILESLPEVGWDHPMADLAWACLEVLKANDWQHQGALQVIEAYEDQRALTRVDHGILLAYILFPNDFSNLIERAYRSSGRWDSRQAEDLFRQVIADFPKKITALDKMSPIFGFPGLLAEREGEKSAGPLGGIPGMVEILSQFAPDLSQMANLVPLAKAAIQFLPGLLSNGTAGGSRQVSGASPANSGGERVIAEVPDLGGDLLRTVQTDAIPAEKPAGRYLPTWFKKIHPRFVGDWEEGVIPWARREQVELWPTVEFFDLKGDLLPSLWLAETSSHCKKGLIQGINVSLAQVPLPISGDLEKLVRFVDRLFRSGIPLSLQLNGDWLNRGWLERIASKVDRFYVAEEAGKLGEAARLVDKGRLYPVLPEGSGEEGADRAISHLVIEQGLGGIARLAGAKKTPNSSEIAG